MKTEKVGNNNKNEYGNYKLHKRKHEIGKLSA